MADDLGVAELRITVNDKEARNRLRDLKAEIQSVAREARAISGGSTNPRSSIRGSVRQVGSPAFSARGARQGGAREGILTLERAQNRRFQIAQRIERLEERGANVSRLRARLGDATTAQAQRQFGTFRQITNELQRQVKLSEARAAREDRIAQALARQARVGGPRESILGRRGLTGSPADLAFLARQGGPRSPIGGALTIPDSPRFLEAARRAGEAQARAFQAEIGRAARAGGARSPIGGAVDIPGSPAFLEAQRRFAAQELSRAAAIGGPRSPIGGTPLLAGSPAAIRAEERLAQARQRATQAAEKAAQAEGRRIGRLNVSPVRGGLAFPGSPAFLDAALPPLPPGFFQRQIQQRQALQNLDLGELFGTAQRRSTLERTLERLRPGPEARKRAGGAISSGLIGGGFPLLFGQGVGAAVGGGVGGLAGGALGGGFGFALSIVGTAVGAAFDEALNKAKTLAEGLRDPIGQFDALRQASLLSSSALERQVEGLIASGREAEAAAQIQLDLARSYGNTEGFAAIKSEFDDLGRAFTQLGLTVADFVSGPLTDFINKLSAATLAPSARAGFNARIAEQGVSAAGRQDIIRQARANIGSLEGLTRPQALVKLYAEANRLLDEQVGKTEAVQQAEAALQDVTTRQTTLDETRLDLIRAQARGYERQALLLQRSEIELQRDQDLSRVPPEQRGAVERKAATDLLRINEQLAALDRDRYATLQLQTAELGIGAQSLQRQITNAIALAKVQTPQGISIERQELERRLQLQESIAAARDKERRIGAQIDAARIRGGDAGEQEASRLVGEQKKAAEETKLALITGSTALKDAAQNLRESAIETQRSLENLRGGNLEFLNPRDQERLLLSLRAQAEPEARRRDISLRSTGGIAEEINLLNRFLNFTRSESQLLEQGTQLAAALEIANRPLIVSNDTLGTNLNALTASVDSLASKDWSVQVNVNGTSGATVIGDVAGALV